MTKQVWMAFAAILLLTCTAMGQDRRWDVSVNAAGALSKQSSGNQVILTPTQGYAVFGSAAFRLAPKFSLQANVAHLDNSQKYATTGVDYRVQSTITEFSGALVVRPFATKDWKPFVFGGAGALVFNPNTTTVIETNPLSPTEIPEDIGATRQTQVAILYGAGVDHPLPVFKFISVRLQYRGLFYSAPSFNLPILFTGQRGHIAEPSIGLVVNF